MRKRGRLSGNVLRFSDETPRDFLLGEGVAVAVKRPVRTSVVVVVDTEPDPDAPTVGVDVVAGPL